MFFLNGDEYRPLLFADLMEFFGCRNTPVTIRRILGVAIPRETEIRRTSSTVAPVAMDHHSFSNMSAGALVISRKLTELLVLERKVLNPFSDRRVLSVTWAVYWLKSTTPLLGLHDRIYRQMRLRSDNLENHD
jgi:hypothetical protein